DAFDGELLATQRITDRGAKRGDPHRGLLLTRAVVTLGQLMRCAAYGDDRASRRIAQHDLGGLGATVDSHEDPPRGLELVAGSSGEETLREGSRGLAVGRPN